MEFLSFEEKNVQNNLGLQELLYTKYILYYMFCDGDK